MVVVTSLLSSELEQYRNGGIDTAWARNPHVVHLGQPGARVVLGTGEGKRRVLADSTHPWIEQDDTVLDPRQVRQAVALEPFEQRQRHRMVVYVDRLGVDVGRVSRLPVVGLVRGHLFLHVTLGRTPCWPRE